MRYLLLLLLPICLNAQISSGTAKRIIWGATLPSTCSPNTGDVFFKTTATLGVYYCSAANTWTIISQTPGTGITSLGGDTTSTQTFSTGTTGTDFAISNPGGGSHVFNLPTASGTNTGKLASADWTTFNGKSGTGSCTNNVVTALTTGTPTCTALTTAYFGAGVLSGTGTKLASTTGTLTSGNCVKIDTNGNFVDNGSVCGSGTGTFNTWASLSSTTWSALQ